MTDGFLGLSWPSWGGLAAMSWLVLFASSWFGLLRVWRAPDDPAGLLVPGIGLGLMALANGVPGTAALLSRAIRVRLLDVPEAAALASMTLAAGVGIGVVAAAGLLADGHVGLVAAGAVIGIIVFPLTFGLVFPLGVPLLCSCLVWRLVKRGNRLSRTGFAVLTSAAAVGWAGVALTGMVLGVA